MDIFNPGITLITAEADTVSLRYVENPSGINFAGDCFVRAEQKISSQFTYVIHCSVSFYIM
jgi:hypothetical protein